MAIDAAIEDSQVQAAIAESKEQTHIDVQNQLYITPAQEESKNITNRTESAGGTIVGDKDMGEDDGRTKSLKFDDEI